MGIFVNIDENGRMVLPKKIREAVGTKRFSVKLVDKEKIVFIPVKSTQEMFGSMPDLNVKEFAGQHAKER